MVFYDFAILEVFHDFVAPLLPLLTGKTQSCLDQLKMHYSSLLHNKSFSLVLGYAVLNPDTPLSESQFQRMQYQELCSHVSPQLFTACLSDLCKTVWQILHSYFQMCNWHDQNMAMFQVGQLLAHIVVSLWFRINFEEKRTEFSSRGVISK